MFVTIPPEIETLVGRTMRRLARSLTLYQEVAGHEARVEAHKQLSERLELIRTNPPEINALLSKPEKIEALGPVRIAWPFVTVATAINGLNEYVRGHIAPVGVHSQITDHLWSTLREEFDLCFIENGCKVGNAARNVIAHELREMGWEGQWNLQNVTVEPIGEGNTAHFVTLLHRGIDSLTDRVQLKGEYIILTNENVQMGDPFRVCLTPRSARAWLSAERNRRLARIAELNAEAAQLTIQAERLEQAIKVYPAHDE